MNLQQTIKKVSEQISIERAALEGSVIAFITYLFFCLVTQDVNVLWNGNNGLSALYVVISFVISFFRFYHK